MLTHSHSVRNTKRTRKSFPISKNFVNCLKRLVETIATRAEKKKKKSTKEKIIKQ